MSFTYDYTLDNANKILICEVQGEISDGLTLVHILKTSVKMAGKNQMKDIVHDVTRCSIRCSNLEMGKFVMETREQGWISDLKIARIVKVNHGSHKMLNRLADRFDLPIKNFTSRSDAMLWLLFDKLKTT
ncbi:hypothetical protein [Paraglaciecola sp. 2405UD69-4]|uniref:hypothetical protein n=1 Tax=Paraglaciecola sp. 2405UD69-4 TaxID=3391836 RepID=UPI0039C9A09E